MGHWFDCMGYGSGHAAGAGAPVSSWCRSEQIQAGPGAFGFFPLVDRKRGPPAQLQHVGMARLKVNTDVVFK